MCLTLWILTIHQLNALFNTNFSFFCCHCLKWATFLTKLKDFPKIRHKNVEYFNLVHAHKPKFGLFLPLPVSNFFLALFPALLFLVSLSLATFCILYPFWLWQKVGCWLRRKPGNGTLISYRSNGHFTTIFVPKLITLTFKLLHHNAIKIRKRVLCRYIYPSSTICLSRMFSDI